MQASDWSGGVGETWAREWQRTDRSFGGLDAALERAILAAAPPVDAVGGRPRLVDLGCGAGTTSLAIAHARDDAEVIGLDLSPDLVAVAVNRAEGIAGVRDRCRFVAGDAVEGAAALAPVELFFSRHGVMFFGDPAAAFARLAEAAAPGARLVFSCFAPIAENPWATETLAAVGAAPAVMRDATPSAGTVEPGPFAFADPNRVAALLAAAGWHAMAAPTRVTYRYVAGAGADPVADALSFFRRIGPAAAALRAAPDAQRPVLLGRLAEACRARRDGDEVAFPATAWLWSAQTQESPR